MKKIFFRNYYKGSLTLELLIAFSVFLINIGAVILIINMSQSFIVDNQINNEALLKAESIMEKTKAEARLDFNLVNSFSIFEDIYQTDLLVEQIDLFTKKVISRVIWKSKNELYKEIEISSLITNPLAVENGETCSSVLINPDNWKQPQYYTFPMSSIFGFNSDEIKISDIDVLENKIYLSAMNTPDSNISTLYIIDLSNNITETPIIISSLDNNNNSKVGLSAIKATKDYLYMANAYAGSSSSCIPNNNCAQFQVVDITDKTNPTIISSANLKIPTITSSGKLAAGTSIFYDHGYVYLGLAKATTGPEFNIIDVGGGGFPASPSNPILKGGYIVGNGINSIFVRDNYAYIASPNNENLIVLDISNPDIPSLVKVGGFTPYNLPNTNGVGSNHGKSLFLVGTTLYLGRTYSPKEFYILDVLDPSDISIKGIPLDIGSGNRTSINKLIVKSFLAFLLTPDQFQIWNISDPENIEPWTLDGTMDSFLRMSMLGGSGITMDCEGDNIYIITSPLLVNNEDLLSIVISS